MNEAKVKNASTDTTPLAATAEEPVICAPMLQPANGQMGLLVEGLTTRSPSLNPQRTKVIVPQTLNFQHVLGTQGKPGLMYSVCPREW